MDKTVRDYMNPVMVYLREGARPEAARRYLLEFGITAVPVVNDQEQPVGVLSLRDLLDPGQRESRISAPAQTIGVDDSIDSAAKAFISTDVHHLVVVSPDGRAVGMISTLDVIRAYLKAPAKHPQAIADFCPAASASST